MKKILYTEFFGHIGKSLEEAELLNKISDYSGGVIYQLHDPATHPNVKNDIEEFARKHKMDIVQQKFNEAKGKGYFYFRLGPDPGKESQRIQGFLSQLPEVLKFKFKVIGQDTVSSIPQEQPPAAAPAPTATPGLTDIIDGL